jgi:uncharacterized protein YuzE
MKMEYDPMRDLLYLHFRREGQKAARTITIMPGVMADFDREGKLIGIEVLDASDILEQKVEFEMKLIPAVAS